MIKIKTSNFATFPCWGNTKKPATLHGFKDAKFNLDTEMMLECGFNIAVACKMSNLIVIDADVHDDSDFNGLEELDELITKLGPLPDGCFKVRTPNSGLHIYAYSDGIYNPNGKIGKSIDIKYNGYCLLPPSKVKGKPYEVLDGINEDGTPVIKPLPKTWIDFINRTSNPKTEKTIQKQKVKEQSIQLTDAKFKTMFDECAFIRHCVLNQNCLEEPLWFAFGCILSNFKNGIELFDLYSQEYPRYTKEATIRKFNNACRYHANCKTIAGIYDGCNQCTKRGKHGN